MNLFTTGRTVAVAGLALAAAMSAAVPASAQQITGAGSTFGTPVYSKWGEAAKAAIGVELNYQSIGSGAGQNQITNRTVDFGASDAPMDPAKIESAKLLQFPSVMGAVVPIVNIPGIAANQMKLTGELLADIYLGKITKWNDPRLVEANNGLKLPSIAIAPVYRADGSGTTYVYTSYLSDVSPAWKSGVGSATSVKWVVGNGAKGNEGVAATVRQVRGGIGYVEFAYAEQNKLATTQLRNKAGQFVTPSMASFQAAASHADFAAVKNFAIDLNDGQGADTWPIMTATFILLPVNPTDPSKSLGVMKFFQWCLTNGGDIATKLDYVPLPKPVADMVMASWKASIKAPDGSAVYK